MRPRTSLPRRHRSTHGFTLVESVVATTVLTIGVLGYVSSVTAGDRLMMHNRETRRAYNAAQTVFATLQADSIDTVFQRYNATQSDDPGGSAASPGQSFIAAGIGMCNGHATTGQGTVRFPSADGINLREDMVDAALGMPRDLDGDGVISSTPLVKAPLVLPVEVKVTWESAGGPREIMVRKFLFGGS